MQIPERLYACCAGVGLQDVECCRAEEAVHGRSCQVFRAKYGVEQDFVAVKVGPIQHEVRCCATCLLWTMLLGLYIPLQCLLAHAGAHNAPCINTLLVTMRATTDQYHCGSLDIDFTAMHQAWHSS